MIAATRTLASHIPQWKKPDPRLLAPLALIPLGTAYCQISEALFEGGRSPLIESFTWAFLTLMPFILGAFLFQLRARTWQRPKLVVLGLGLGAAAYALSSLAAILLGAELAFAFVSRLPLLATAVTMAAIYPIEAAGTGSPPESAVDPDDPPVEAGEALFACAAGNYIELRVADRTIMWRQTMRNAERLLRPSGFMRVHRSYLVPRRSIDTVTYDRKGPRELILRNGSRVPVSDRYAANLRH